MKQNLADNKKARFDYEILETHESGIELAGHEVRSVKLGRLGLAGSYVIIRDGQAWLLNAQIPPYQVNNVPEKYEPTRTRRLLLHKKEIATLAGLLQQKSYTLIPLRAYMKANLIKLEVGVGRARKKHDKRELLKERDTRREMRKAI